MGHRIETMWSGEDRKPWWHGMDGKFATVTSDKGVNWKKALKLAEADWNVDKKPLYAYMGDEPMTADVIPGSNPFWDDFSGPSKDFYGLVRDKDQSLLHVVGSRYRVIQNAETFHWASDILDVSEGTFVTAWVLMEGRVVGCTLLLPKEIVVGGKKFGERLPTYLNVVNWHGGGSLVALTGPVRTECWNTLMMAFNAKESEIRIRHTAKALHRLQEARKVLQISYERNEEFEAALNALLKEAATDKTLTKTFGQVFPEPAADKARATWSNRLDEVQTVFKESPNLENVRGTKYGVYNAFTEWSQWGRNFYGSKGEDTRNDQLRPQEVLFGSAREIGEKAFTALVGTKKKVKASV